jgi:hypothetical protein
MKVSIFLFVFLGFIAYAILTEQNFSQYAQTSVVENGTRLFLLTSTIQVIKTKISSSPDNIIVISYHLIDWIYRVYCGI